MTIFGSSRTLNMQSRRELDFGVFSLAIAYTRVTFPHLFPDAGAVALFAYLGHVLQRAAPSPGARLSHADGGVARGARRRSCGHDGQRGRVAHMPTGEKTAARSNGSMISGGRSGRSSNQETRPRGPHKRVHFTSFASVFGCEFRIDQTNDHPSHTLRWCWHSPLACIA